MASLGINGEAAGDYVQQCFFTEGYCSSPGPLCAEPRCRRGSTEPGDCRHERQRLCRESGETLAWDDIPKVSWGGTVSRDKCSSHSSGEPSTMMTMLVVIKDDDGHHHPHPPSPHHHHHRHKIVITIFTIILVLVTITIVSLVISGSNLDEQSDNDKGDVGVEEERAIIWIRTGSMNKVIAMTATSALMGILTLDGNDDDHDDDDMLVMTMLLTMMMMTMMMMIMIMIMMPMVAKMTRQEPQPETSFKH